MLYAYPMLRVVVLPLIILIAGAIVAATGRTRNRALTLGASVILAVLCLAAMLSLHPSIV